MIPISPPALSPPLLLATDGSPSARLAQKLVCFVLQTLPAQSRNRHHVSQEHPAPASSLSEIAPTLLTVVTVQPKVPNRSRLFSKRNAPSQVDSTKVPLANQPANQPVNQPANQPVNQPVNQPTSQETGQEAPQADGMATVATHRHGNEAVKFMLDQESLTALVKRDFPEPAILSLQVRQGRPTTEILNCARTIQAGLIAVGYRGMGGMRELLLGSVATAIARYAPCSVLVARGRADATTEPDLGHVLVVVENAPATQQAIAAVQQLVPAGIRQVTLLHIQHPLNVNYLFGPFVAPAPSWQLSQSLQQAQKEEGEALLQRAKTTMTLPEITVQTRLQTGDPGPTICQIAQELQVNLIIIGSDSTRRSLLSPLQSPLQTLRHPRQGKKTSASPLVLRNTRLSITEDYVIHYAPCPVLLCKPSPFKGE